MRNYNRQSAQHVSACFQGVVQGTNATHLGFLEVAYICTEQLELCRQKEFVGLFVSCNFSTWHQSKTVLCVCVCVCVVCVCVSKWKKECQTNGKHSKRKSQTQWKEKYRKGRGPFRQSSHCHPDKRKRERLSTKSTHVTVYLFRDLNRDRSRLLWMTVGPKGQYSAKRRTRNRQSSKTFKRWSNLHRRRPLAVLRTSGVIVHLAPGRERHFELLVMYDQTFGTRTLLAHAQQRRKEKKKKKKNQSSKKEEK